MAGEAQAAAEVGASCCAWFEGAGVGVGVGLGVVGALEAHPEPLEPIGFVAATGAGDTGAAAVTQGDSAGAADCDGGATLVGAPHCVNA